ncbi:arylsulfatase J isoform X2 [Manduca sexta]|uniref:arylsulfatase J isoform X2 n=1 Tax=Manduca sexta TaxID=7130 RepID=UPI0018902D2F|nr:arylsulfatase J isoform X2 [Manduca sexta]
MICSVSTHYLNLIIIIMSKCIFKGWDDVSFHGSDQILTPNIDLLAYSGVALGRYYSHCICTPSRSALMTGKYAHILGMQGYPLTNTEDRGLPTSEKILPQYLKELGYATHLIGKWHIGQSRTEYLPTSRGFDSHFGHRGGYVDYYEYTLEERLENADVSGFGLFRNETAAWDVEGYLTDVYSREAISIITQHNISSPLFLMLAHNAPHSSNAGAMLQAPPEEVRKMRHIESGGRRIYAAMVKKLDDSVGYITQALFDKGILDNTVIVFIADNGGMTSGDSMNYASNWPLRGLKMSPFEGGTRVVGLVWSASFNNSNHLWNGYMHVTDWLPTILSMAKGNSPKNINGIDQWHNIQFNEDSKREEMFEIDDYTGYASITSGDFKLVTGNVIVAYSDYQGDDLRRISGDRPSYMDAIVNSKLYNILHKINRRLKFEDINLRNEMCINCDSDRITTCYPQNGTMCLFNIKDDPCEAKDLSASRPDVVKTMTARLNIEKSKTKARKVPLFRDPRSSPRFLNYTWDVWADNIKEISA